MYKPTPGYVLVKPDEKETKTESGIYLPESSEKPQTGKVVAIGDKTKDEECPVKVDDLILYKKWGGNDVKIDGVEYQFLKFEDILGVK